MYSATELLSSPWTYAALSVVISVFSILCAFFYTKRKQEQLIAKINKETQRESRSQDGLQEDTGKDKETISEKIGFDAWPSETKAEKELELLEKRDPVEFCDHIPSEIKKTQQRIAMKKLQEEMNEEDKAREREVQRKQLEEIFKLMAQNDDKFGVDSFEEIQEQMTLYAQ